MSGVAHTHTDALQGRDIVPDNRVDPTGTSTLRRRYAQRLRAPFADLNTLIREGVREQDRLGLRTNTEALQDGDLPPFVDLQRDPQKREAFLRWLDRQVERDILSVISRNNNPFVRSAYGRGLLDAQRALQHEGVDVDFRDMEEMFNLPVHRDTLERLFTTNFEDLEGVTSAMSEQIAEELTQGFAEGVNPNEMARRITDRVDKVGKHRATLLARTKTIEAHADATLNRYEELGVEQVTIRAEWLTAGDARVCPICITLEGNTWTIQEARTATFRVTEDDVRELVPQGRSLDPFTGDFPVRPPSHVQCRCRLIPEVVN